MKSTSRAHHALLIPALLGAIALPIACGDVEKPDGGGSPVASPTPLAPVATLAPIQTPGSGGGTFLDDSPAPFWVASASQRLLSRYDANGNLSLPVVDLQGRLPRGGVSQLHFLAPQKLLAFLEPGENETVYAESIVEIDPGTGQARSGNWYTDGARLIDVQSAGMVSGFIASSLLVQTQTGIIRVLYGTGGGVEGQSFIGPNSLAGCEFAALENFALLKHGESRALVLLASGARPGLLVIGLSAGAPTCLFRHDFTTDGLTTSTHVPRAALMVPGTHKLAVLYAHPMDSRLVGYEFDGSRLTSPGLIFRDQGILGNSPRGLAARTPSRFLVGNPEADKVYEIDVRQGSFTGFFIQNSYVVDVSGIATER